MHYTLWLYDASQPEGKGTQIQTSVGGQPFSTNYMTVTLATSIGPAPEPAAKAGVLAASAGDARRKR